MEESENNSDLNAAPVTAPKVDPKILIGVVVLVLLAIYIVVTFGAKLSQISVVPEVEVTIGDQVEIDPATPKRIESAGVVPEGFPEDIPVEATKLEQSYTINYPEGEQSTVVFLADKTIKEVYDTYLDLLMKNAWILVNVQESTSPASIYALKDNRELNVTISSNEQGQTQVSLSAVSK